MLTYIVTITGRSICSVNSSCDNNGMFICSAMSYCDDNAELYMQCLQLL